MNNELVEKAAIACFPGEVKDSYVRMMLMVVLPVIKQNQKLTVNKLFSIVRNIVPITEAKELLPVVMALDTPFKCVTINSYRRYSNREGSTITDITYVGSDVWDNWVAYVIKQYPEMSIWLERSYGATV